MNGARSRAASAIVYVTALNPGDTSWVCPATKYYTITARGAGGGVSGGSGGGSGGATQKTELIRFGEIVTLSIGRAGGRGINGNGGDTVVTFPSGNVMTAGGGVGPTTGGTAAGGDLNVPGNAAVSGAGGNAPAIGNFPAVAAALSNNTNGAGTGGSTDGGSTNQGGGQGIVIIQSGKAPRIL
jgi:hypothetical protein